METLYGIVVIYNKSLEQSSSYESLRENQNIRLVVCDNSTEENDNKEICDRYGSIYLAMGGNKGLSAAYNRAIDYISGEYGYQGWVCIFDDDTTVPGEYFQVLSEAVSQYGTGIYLPVVKDALGVMSPLVIDRSICRRAKGNPADIPYNKISGINSGMAVSMELYKDYRYNEEMFLDYIDHEFIREMKKKGVSIKVMDVILVQSFSMNSDDKKALMGRFAIQKKDWKIFYSKGLWQRFVYTLMVLKRTIKIYCK